MKSNRKTFIKNIVSGAATVSAGSLLPGFIIGNDISKAEAKKISSSATTTVPENIAGMTLQELRDDYKDRIFNQYLPFWDKGGYDKELGGFMCELYDDGSVQNDEKYIWYQGRAIWVYSFLYNNLGRDKKHLEIASKTRDFMIKNMYLGDGRWRESVNRKGIPVESKVAQGTSSDIYGAMFSAAGLIELFKATSNKEDLEIAKKSIMSSVKAYESPNYAGITVNGINEKGLRTLGHSFMIIWVLNNLLRFQEDAQLEELQNEHINHIINDFWNPEYGINNENLFHDYSRLPGYESVMYTGHYLETLWILLQEALRKKDKQLFNTVKKRIRRIIEMGWDYVFDGLGTENYYVFGSKENCQGAEYDLKVMWAHTELLISTMMVLEYTGETWAKEWYERGRAYCLKNMANTGNGVWRQAVDRFGKDKKRPDISVFRKDNFHQIRYQMMNLLSLERMINNNYKTSQV
ncbi:MAG TPA: AGE family epimerase/isomerase [Bacteroidales bacterium]|nr:AGE family epimerase/isomerase [Bacteroidales bacterium]HPT21449.1 AGE family epimerase/isomerase [Bacteroidales bacterium]